MKASLERILRELLDTVDTKQFYETDYQFWLADQIQMLRQGRLHELDVPHLVEELEGLSNSDEFALESYLIVLLTYLLKWEYQPEKRCGSWDGSITNSRNRIARIFKQQKFGKRVEEFIPEAYQETLEWASKETKIRVDLFPKSCPYITEQLLDKNWLPQ